LAAIELYKCICGVYVTEKLKLCEQCASQYGNDYTKWPFWLRSLYQDVNFGRNYEYSEFDKLGRPGMVRSAPLGTAKARAREKDAPKIEPMKAGRRLCPVCFTPIRANKRLCNKCLAKYGSDQSKWPAWLAGKSVEKLVDGKLKTEWLDGVIAMDQKVIDYERNHRETAINDETFTRRQAPTYPGRAGGKIPGSFGKRTIASVNQDNLSFDQIEWLDNDFEGPEDTDTAPGSIAGDKNGYRYNAAAWQGSNSQYQELASFGERDFIEDNIAAKKELEQWDPTAAAALLLYETGYTQSEISQLLKIRQQKVSEILKKAVKGG